MQKSVVMCSGGLNSAVLLALARDAGPVLIVHASHDHPAAEREAQIVAKLAAHYDHDRLSLNMMHFAAIRDWLKSQATPASKSELASALPQTADGAPGFMATLLGMAGTVAAAIGAARIWLGVSEIVRADGAADADAQHSREFVQLMEYALAMAAPRGSMTIETPLIDLSGGDIVRLARRLEVPLKLTWSCHASPEAPCQKCAGCRRRTRGFLDAPMPDPLLIKPVTA